MKYVIVELICPSVSGSYDYSIPIRLKVGDIKRRIIEDIRIYEQLPMLFLHKNDVSLYCKEGCLDDEMTFEYAGIKNGDQIMII